MDLKVSLKSENGLLNFLKKRIKKIFGYRHLAPRGAYYGATWRILWRHMSHMMAPHGAYDGTTWRI